MSSNISSDDDLLLEDMFNVDSASEYDDFDKESYPSENNVFTLNQKAKPLLNALEKIIIENQKSPKAKDIDSLILTLSYYKEIFADSFELMFGLNKLSQIKNRKKLISIAKRITKAHHRFQELLR